MKTTPLFAIALAVASLTSQSCVAPPPAGPPPRPAAGTYAADYRHGFNRGRDDRKAGKSRYYHRHSKRYYAGSESAFARGYYDGWDGRKRAM
jgi:hypothetical protein